MQTEIWSTKKHVPYGYAQFEHPCACFMNQRFFYAREGERHMSDESQAIRFSTPRMDIKDMRLDDCAYAASEWGHPVYGQYMADPMYRNGDELKEILRDELVNHAHWEDDFYFSVFRRGTNDIIGTACAYAEKEEGVWGIGYSIDHELWGRGLGKELIAGLLHFVKAKGTQVASAQVAQQNTASVKACLHNGMQIHEEGQFRKSGTDIVHPSYDLRKRL